MSTQIFRLQLLSNLCPVVGITRSLLRCQTAPIGLVAEVEKKVLLALVDSIVRGTLRPKFAPTRSWDRDEILIMIDPQTEACMTRQIT